MRIVKDGDERRKEILHVARTFFIQNGYENTSINDILKQIGIAKGTFYYYFASKEEILESIIKEIVEEGIYKANHILKDESIPLVLRIVQSIMVQKPDFEGQEVIRDQIHHVDNPRLERLYMKYMLQQVKVTLLPTIMEGINQGIFNTPYPEEALESTLLMGHLFFDINVYEWDELSFQKKITTFLYQIERIFEAKPGTFNPVLKMFEN